MLVVTIDSLPGYEIRQVIGEVVGVTARPRNKFTEGARSLDGTLSSSGEHFLIAGRREAVERMAFHAREAGANAVVGMKFDHRTISNLWMEISAYGTAVVAVPLRVTAMPPRRLIRGRGRRAVAPDPEPALYEATMNTDGVS
jgi:uncharacterized protein YbjQ (UPF0145 family)